MSWVRLDDGFFDHEKTLAVGEDAAFLFLAGLAYCNKQLTDGRIPKSMVPRLTSKANWRALADRLCQVLVPGKGPYWHDRGDHYESHAYLEWNDSRETVLARREREATRKRRARESSAERASSMDGAGDSAQESRRESARTPHGTPAGPHAGVRGSTPLLSSPQEENDERRVVGERLTAAFEALWRTWPPYRRREKGTAREVYARLVGEDPDLVPLIQEAAEAWSETDDWRREGGKYVPELHRWLRKRRWTDELPVTTHGPSEGNGDGRARLDELPAAVQVPEGTPGAVPVDGVWILEVGPEDARHPRHAAAGGAR